MKIFLLTFFLTISFSFHALDQNQNQSQWIESTQEGWKLKSLLNVGEPIGKNEYRLVGVPRH